MRTRISFEELLSELQKYLPEFKEWELVSIGYCNNHKWIVLLKKDGKEKQLEIPMYKEAC